MDRGRFIIYYRGEEAGSETYGLYRLPDGMLLLESQCQLALPRGAGNYVFDYKVTELMSSDYSPVQYDDVFTVNGLENYIHVKFQNGSAEYEALIAGQSMSRTDKVHPNCCLLEEAVYSLYIPLYKRYGLTGEERGTPKPGKKSAKNQDISATAGKKAIPVYIPKSAAELNSSITYNGESTVPSPLGELKLKRYSVDLGGLQGSSVTVNQTGQLIKIQIPRQEIEVIRDFNYDLRPVAPAQPPPAPAQPPPAPAPDPKTGEDKGGE